MSMTDGLMSCLIIVTVVSAEQYAEPPSADLRFPNKEDLVNYTRNKDMSEIIVPSTLVRKKLEEENDGRCMHENRRSNYNRNLLNPTQWNWSGSFQLF